MDKARWGLGKNELPGSVISFGGRFGYVDDGETANTQVCLFDYGDCDLVFEVRGLLCDSPFPGNDRPGRAATSSATSSTAPKGSSSVRATREALPTVTDGEVIKRFNGGEDHFGNFVKAVRSRKSRRPQRRHPRGTPFQRALPPGQRQLPARHAAALQPEG